VTQPDYQVRPLRALPTCTLGFSLNLCGNIHEIRLLPPETPLASAQSPLEIAFCQEIQCYLGAPNYAIHLPLATRGTPFQQRVWQLIREIPTGRTRNYAALAADLHSVARAVGQACGANPFPLITPCHRVLGKKSLGGFAHAEEGWLIDTKRWLLIHENAL
jgi:methylated-DNA-[protein]-cysteine S-methyltransferase